MKRTVLTLMVLAATVMAAPVFAASANDQFTVSATVIGNCTITAGDLAFGNYDPVGTNNTGGSDLYANSTLTVACTKGTPNVWIGLDAGSNGASASSTTRALTDGSGNFMDYELYTADPNPAPGAAWGNTQATGASYNAVTKNASNITVYGRAPKGQDVSAGSYSDTITATINY